MHRSIEVTLQSEIRSIRTVIVLDAKLLNLLYIRVEDIFAQLAF